MRRTAHTIAAALGLWGVTYVSGFALGYLGLAVGGISILFLLARAMRCARREPSDRIGAVVLGLAAGLFGISLFLPLWGHTGFGYTEEGDRVISYHRHTLFEANHIH